MNPVAGNRGRWSELSSVAFMCILTIAFVSGTKAQTIARDAKQTNATASKLSFNQQIQPILSENCYPCHGPDPGARKAKLRLDRAEFAYAPHDKSGPAIVPGRTEQSPLVRKIEAKKAKDRMPPPEAH